MIKSIKRWLAWRRTMRVHNFEDRETTAAMRRAVALMPRGQVALDSGATPWRPGKDDDGWKRMKK
jgi:hypothetical protein